MPMRPLSLPTMILLYMLSVVLRTYLEGCRQQQAVQGERQAQQGAAARQDSSAQAAGRALRRCRCQPAQRAAAPHAGSDCLVEHLPAVGPVLETAGKALKQQQVIAEAALAALTRSGSLIRSTSPCAQQDRAAMRSDSAPRPCRRWQLAAPPRHSGAAPCGRARWPAAARCSGGGAASAQLAALRRACDYHRMPGATARHLAELLASPGPGREPRRTRGRVGRSGRSGRELLVTGTQATGL